MHFRPIHDYKFESIHGSLIPDIFDRLIHDYKEAEITKPSSIHGRPRPDIVGRSRHDSVGRPRPGQLFKKNFRLKYLKYKQKYINLKNALN